MVMGSTSSTANASTRSSWLLLAKSAQGFIAHFLLFSFTLLLSFKLDDKKNLLYSSISWWMVFVPLWLFHAVIARSRFSLPAPSLPHDRHWAPCHSVVATPLLLVFQMLLCIYLHTRSVQGNPILSLKIVFIPLVLFEVIILIDNFRMCRTLMPGDEESMSDEVIWETLPHFWVAISMIFLITATMLTVLKLCGEVNALSWWDLFINFGIAQCFAFLVCTKWTNPMIHRQPLHLEPGTSSTTTFHYDCNGGLVISVEDDSQCQLCGLPDIGGHIMKIPIIAFQVLLFMRLEGTTFGARKISIPILFLPLILLQGAGVLFAILRLGENIVLLFRNGSLSGHYLSFSSRLHDCFSFLHHGSRLIGWWPIDEGSKEEQARLFHAGATVTGYNTFCGYPPEIVKKMAKKDLTEEIWRLQAVLGEQSEITKYSQEEYERLQNEKVLCRVCFERDICMVLLPCRHRTLCRYCSDKCKKCPICRVPIEQRMTVYDV
ncbi:Baculoviral IAP repeat-containing protein [Zostera marina]|uniref:Baculoviral IAP repeat-containing protein n=1 Tax=Zostera marina TaxID=29655 RepID=A0A0K9Q0L3_ZOSMR|nr:Baculoviral IAP repeat-containing protein [Zostera marina]